MAILKCIKMNQTKDEMIAEIKAFEIKASESNLIKANIKAKIKTIKDTIKKIDGKLQAVNKNIGANQKLTAMHSAGLGIPPSLTAIDPEVARGLLYHDTGLKATADENNDALSTKICLEEIKKNYEEELIQLQQQLEQH